MKPLQKMARVGHMTLAKTLSYLLDNPATAQDICAYTGIHLVTAQEWMRALRKERTVYISAWEPDTKGRDVTPVYTLGRGRDAQRRRKSRAQIAADYRARKKLKDIATALTTQPNGDNLGQ